MAPINRITRNDVEAFKDEQTAATIELGTMSSLDLYQRTATKSAFYPGQGTALGLIYVALKLNGESGEFAEHVGKAMRDDELVEDGYRDEATALPCIVPGELTPERKVLLIKEAGDVLWYLSAICNELGVALSDVAYGNLVKLCDRGERDALQGSGDTR